MNRITIASGVLIALISPVSILLAGHFAGTALIPAGFGAVLILCGVLAANPARRKHAMHAAALIGLLGALGGLGMSIPKLLKGVPLERPVAVYSQLAEKRYSARRIDGR